MPRIVYVADDGTRREVDGTSADSVMSVAVRNGVSGILAECGGSCTCATCHVYVDHDFLPLVGPPGDLEDDMLDLAVTDRRSNSRLSCQIKVREELDGLTVTLPSVQP